MRRAVLALALAAICGTAMARLVEQQMDVPVRVTDAYGKAIEQPIKVTVFFDDKTPAPRPLLVLSHGRSYEAQDRAALGRVRYSDASRWLAQRGFVVAVPTRIGYGASGGEDIEDSGSCERKNYPPGYAAAAQQVLQVMARLRERDDVAKDRAVVMGQSYGGTTAITLAALSPEGVVAAINFAGGGGGNPKTQPGRPCAPQRLQRMFADYGKTARMPTLWVYTENDQYMGLTYPREWFEAFHASGGVGEFVQFPPHGDDGHSLFSRFPQTWRPVVADFLQRQGFDMKESP